MHWTDDFFFDDRLVSANVFPKFDIQVFRGINTADAIKLKEETRMNLTGKIALFLGGTLFGSAGIKLLGSKDVRKVYAHVTAAALRCKDQVMRDVETVQEGCSDILADAKAINEARAAKEAEFIEDSAQA